MENQTRLAVRQLVRLLLQEEEKTVKEGLGDRSIGVKLVRAAGNFTEGSEQDILEGVLDAFDEKPTSNLLDAVWTAWDETRQPRLEQWLLEHHLPASKPLRLVSLSLLKLGNLQSIAGGWKIDREAVSWIEPILNLVSDPDAVVAAGALQVLETIPQSAPEAREEVCRWVVEHNHPTAAEVALRAGYEPRQPQLKALFYLLTDQWEVYEVLDFDRRLLTTVLEAADEPLRRKIAQAALKAGWSDFVEVAAGGRTRRQLADLSEFEWDVILMVLGRESRWGEVWKLAQSAPARWSAKLLRSLCEQNWQPGNEADSTAYRRLCTAAQEALKAGDPACRLVRYETALTGHPRLVTALAGFPEQDLLASASADQTVRLWDLKTGRQTQVLDGHSSFVLCLAAGPQMGESGAILASGSADRTIRLWHIPEGELVQTLGGHSEELVSLAFNQDGTILVSMDSRTINIWRLPEGELIRTIQGMFSGLVSSGISPDGAYLAALDGDKTLRLFSLPQGELVQTLLEPVVGWVFSPPSNLTSRLFTSSSYGTVRPWNVGMNESSPSLPGRVNTNQLLADPAGNWLVCADRSAVRVWHLPESENSKRLEGHALLVTSLAASPDGQILASGAEDHTIRLWQMPLGIPLPGTNLLEGLSGGIRLLRYLAGSGRGAADHIAASDGSLIYLWVLDDLDSFLRRLPGSFDILELNRWEKWLTSLETGSPERKWLSFGIDLAHWQRRYDIDLQETTPMVSIGDYDIEIAAVDEDS